jgi:hypothetical protein
MVVIPRYSTFHKRKEKEKAATIATIGDAGIIGDRPRLNTHLARRLG